MKATTVELPQLIVDVILRQFRNFKTNWNEFKRITNIPKNQLYAQLYSTCDDYVQNSLVNSVTDSFNFNEE